MLCGKGLVYLFRKTIVGKPYCKRYLQYDDCRHTNIEFLVHRLVMKNSYSKPCTDAATKDRHKLERRFRNTSLYFYSLILVNAVDHKRHDIDKQ